ncbi:MAG: hypothetical protein RSB37_00520 [Acetivibrio sp.]
MRKIWYSMLYGDFKTKVYLWSMVILFILSMSFFGAALITWSFPIGVGGAVALCLDVLIYLSISFEELVKDGEKQALKKRVKKQLNQKKDGEELIEESGMEELVKKNKEEMQKEEDREENKKTHLDQYDDKTIKQLMIQYKVKKEHKKIMIDISQTFHIKNCPAYIWKERKEVFLLLLEEKPRIIHIPIEKIRTIGYEKMVDARPSIDYGEFKEHCMITKLFSEFLPQYKEGTYRGKPGVYKNLYRMAPDIQITNTSARNLFDVLGVDFEIKDEVTNSDFYSAYYKMAYKTNILWKDGVIGTSEYKEKIKELLNLVATEKLSKQIFDELLEQLVKNKLITIEYAAYYRELRK